MWACGEIGVISKGINEFCIECEYVLLRRKGVCPIFGVIYYENDALFSGKSRSISSFSSINLRICFCDLL